MALSRRDEFYADLIVTAIENFGYGSFETLAYTLEVNNAMQYETMPSAIIKFYDDPNEYEITRDVFSRAFTTLRKLKEKSNWIKRMLKEYDSLNSYDFDVVDALNLMEIGLFGEVVYA